MISIFGQGAGIVPQTTGRQRQIFEKLFSMKRKAPT